MYSDDDFRYEDDEEYRPDDDDDIIDRDEEEGLGSNRSSTPFGRRSTSGGGSPFSSRSSAGGSSSPFSRKSTSDDGDSSSGGSGLGSGWERPPASTGGSGSSGSSPFSRATSGGSSGGGDDDDDDRSRSGSTRPSPRTSGTSGSGGSPFSGGTTSGRSTFGSRPSGGDDRTSSGGGTTSGRSTSGTSSSGGSPFSGGTRPSPRTSGTSSSGGSPFSGGTTSGRSTSGGSTRDLPGGGRTPSGGGSRSFGGNRDKGDTDDLRTPSGGGFSRSSRDKPPGGQFSSQSRQSSGGDKPARGGDKPSDDKPDSGGDKPTRSGGLGFSFGNRGKKPAEGDAPAADGDKPKRGVKPDGDGDKPASGGNDRLSNVRGALGGVTGAATSRMGGLFGRGKKSDDKPAEDDGDKDDKPASGSKPSGGGAFSNRGPSGGSAPTSGGGGAFSNRGPSGGSAPTSGDKSGAGAQSATAKKGGAPFGGSSGRSIGKSSGKPAEADTPAEGDAKPAAAGIGARFAAMTATLPFIGKPEEKPRSKAARQQNKAPKVKQGLGLSLDRKLDILGVGLVLVSLALMLSSLSPTQGIATKYVNDMLGQFLGWGAIAVPVSMFAVGMWLIVRHFGDEAPTLDVERLVGLAILYIGLLVLFQFIRSFSYQNITTYADLELQTRLSWEVLQNGGGWLGGNLYLTLVRYLGEVLAFSVTLFVLMVGIMFTLDLSVSEIAIILVGVYRSSRAASRRSSERKRVRRAERLAKRQEQVAALAPPPTVDVSKPQAQALGAGDAAGGALPAPTDGRAIPITMGGKTVNTSMTGEAQAAAASAGEAQPAAKRGLFGRGLAAVGVGAAVGAAAANSNNGNAAQAVPSANDNSGGLMSRLPFGRRKPATPPAQTGIQTTGLAASATDVPATANATVQAATAPQAAPAPSAQPPAPPTFAPPTPSVAPPSPAPSTMPTSAPVSPPADPAPSAPTPTPQRKATPFDAVLGKPVGADTPPPDASPPSRVDRLNALRQGETAHPNQQGAAPPPPPSDAASSTNGAGKMVVGKTDAYGNAPTPPTNTRPDQLKPEPQRVPNPTAPRREWKLPSIADLLNEGSEQDFDRKFLVDQARIIEETLRSFGAPGRVVEINTGPVITQYGVEPDYLQSRSGKKNRVKVSAIAQLDRDLQLALGARSIRIEAPVPGKGYVGIEIPNAENALVSLKDVMEADNFVKKRKKSPLSIALGQSVDGTPMAADLTSMPHLLIAGTTGSGKSVCINSIICSMLANNTPEDLRFIMVDPKRVELTGYNDIPHLVAPVVVELERIVGVLKWVTREMDERYKRFSNAGARNIVDFNKHLPTDDERMPYIVVIIDELADLMMMAPEETERTITRIAALARATGIHLVIATQRPSVDVVTGLIKANFPARIAFAVAGSVDSRVILDQPGAERLLGRGDMLYLSGDSPAPQRLQGVFVSDEEIENITRYWKAQSGGKRPMPVRGMAPLSLDPASAPRQMTPSGVSGIAPSLGTPASLSGNSADQRSFWEAGMDGDSKHGGEEVEDELYAEAVEMVRRLDKASASLLQRRLRIGYTRAARLIELMEQNNIVGSQESGSKSRNVLIK